MHITGYQSAVLFEHLPDFPNFIQPWLKSVYYSLLGYDTIYYFRWVPLLPEDGGSVFFKNVDTHLQGYISLIT
jgi:hypothetical protein